MPSRLSRAALGLLLTPAVLVAQSPQPRPTFRSGVQNIEVDVLVTDQKGNTVRGLTKDDFTLLEDGKQQRISAFSFIDLPIEPPAARLAAAKTVESDITTNTTEGRVYVLLFNKGGEKARLIARRFIDEAIQPNDLVAVIHPLGLEGDAQGFTSNRSLMVAAIDRMAINYQNQDFATRMSYEVVEQVSERLGLISGRRKALLWFSPELMDFDATDSTAFMHRDAIRAAQRNNVAIYTVMGEMTLAMGAGGLKHNAMLRLVAEDTGGDSIVNTNNVSPGFERFVRDNSSYYLLAYEPTVEHRDGKFHDLNVRVNRPGVTVRARRGYYAPDPDAEKRATTRRVEGLSLDTTEALRVPASVTGLGIEVFAAPFKGTGANGSVVLGAQLRGPDLVLGGGQRIEFAYQAMTTEGKQAPGAFKVFTLDYKPESREAIERTGLRVIERLALPRGRHQVRFVVSQPNGKTGSVVADVEVPDYTRTPLVMSGIVIASQQMAAQRTVDSDARLKSILSSDPTTVRRFARRDVLTAFAEVYLDGKDQGDYARMNASVSSVPNGKPRPQRPVAMEYEFGRTGYVTRVRLADFEPGDYVLTLDASSSRGKATRQVPFSIFADQ